MMAARKPTSDGDEDGTNLSEFLFRYTDDGSQLFAGVLFEYEVGLLLLVFGEENTVSGWQEARLLGAVRDLEPVRERCQEIDYLLPYISRINRAIAEKRLGIKFREANRLVMALDRQLDEFVEACRSDGWKPVDLANLSARRFWLQAVLLTLLLYRTEPLVLDDDEEDGDGDDFDPVDDKEDVDCDDDDDGGDGPPDNVIYLFGRTTDDPGGKAS